MTSSDYSDLDLPAPKGLSQIPLDEQRGVLSKANEEYLVQLGLAYRAAGRPEVLSEEIRAAAEEAGLRERDAVVALAVSDRRPMSLSELREWAALEADGAAMHLGSGGATDVYLDGKIATLLGIVRFIDDPKELREYMRRSGTIVAQAREKLGRPK